MCTILKRIKFSFSVIELNSYNNRIEIIYLFFNIAKIIKLLYKKKKCILFIIITYKN